MLKDNFGAYEVTFNYLEPTNNKHYEMRKYVNSKKIKSLGGMYAIYCEEDNSIIFRKSEYLRDRSYSAFTLDKCVDIISCSQDAELVDYPVYENNNCMHIVKVRRYYSLPSEIDITKLTEEEFSQLRRLIKKSLPDG